MLDSSLTHLHFWLAVDQFVPCSHTQLPSPVPLSLDPVGQYSFMFVPETVVKTLGLYLPHKALSVLAPPELRVLVKQLPAILNIGVYAPFPVQSSLKAYLCSSRLVHRLFAVAGVDCIPNINTHTKRVALSNDFAVEVKNILNLSS